jgi:sec-independent protein translocase protein TatB
MRPVFNLSGSEIIVILLLALVVLGPEKLPDAVRRAGRTYAELKRMGNSFQAEVKSALDEPLKEMQETANLMRNAADFSGEPSASPAPSRPEAARAAIPPAATSEDLINRTLSGGGSAATAAGDGIGPTPSSDDVPTTEEPGAVDESPRT